MRTTVSLKTLLRSPARTILTFILLGLVSFAFFTQVSGYVVTRRELNNAALLYRGVGIAETSTPSIGDIRAPFYIEADPRISENYVETEKVFYYPNLLRTDYYRYTLDEIRYQPLTRNQIAAISGLPYIEVSDTRYMTAGVSDEYFRLDEGLAYFPYTGRCIVEGTIREIKVAPPPPNTPDPLELISYNRLILDDCVFLAGHCPYEDQVDEGIIQIHALCQAPITTYSCGWYDPMRDYSFVKPEYRYDTEYIESLTPGQRYVFVLRFEPLKVMPDGWTHRGIWAGPVFDLYDYLTDTWCDAIWPIEGEPGNYIEMEKFAPLRELMEITNTDAHTFDVVYTEDMGVITRFSEGFMGIDEGRTLTREDSESGSALCVISSKVASAYDLGVGDTFTLKLGTELFEQYRGWGAIAATRQRYCPPVKDVTLEIVGIYADKGPSKKPHWSYSVNTVFVPKSLLPADESVLLNHAVTPAEFSFMIDSAWNTAAFLQEANPLFEELGLRLNFNDKGWLAMEKEYRTAIWLSVINIAVFSVAVFLTTGLTVYLFIGRKRKEYAIMRALGTPKGKSARALILPLMSVTAVSVLAGSGVAWLYTVRSIEQSNTLLALKDFSVNPAIPMWVAFGCIFGELLLALLSALAMLRRLGRTSPLALLQGGSAAAPAKKPEYKAAAATESSAVLGKGNIGSMFAPQYTGKHMRRAAWKEYAGGMFVPQYIGRHMLRAAWKSALPVLLAALLVCAVGQLASMRQSYVAVFKNTVITARIFDLKLGAARRIADTELAANPYYESTGNVSVGVDVDSVSGRDFASVSFVFTNNIAHYAGEEVDVAYGQGYDEACMDRLDDNIVIVGRAFFDERGFELGDEVTIRRLGLYDDAQSHSAVFTIAGVVSTPSKQYNSMIFSPGSYAAEKIGMPAEVDVAEYTIADNDFIEEFRASCESIAGADATIIIDTSRIENVRNSIRLINALYPIILVAALLIGGSLCSLIILQSSKEVAIMRVLGTTKTKTRTILSLEQALLSAAGLAVGTYALSVLKRQALANASMELAHFAALYFIVISIAAVACSTFATRRSPLELLQTKE